VLDVDRAVYEITLFLDWADISVIRLVGKEFHVFETMAKELMRKKFLSRLVLYFGTEDVAILFCKTFLSRFDYCFSGSSVLAAICYGKIENNVWDKDTSLFIADNPKSVYAQLEGWLSKHSVSRSVRYKVVPIQLKNWTLDISQKYIGVAYLDWKFSVPRKGASPVHRRIKMYFTRSGDLSPKEYTESHAQFTILSNWMTVDAHGEFNYRIGNINHICRGVAMYTEAFQREWASQWSYWLSVEKPGEPIQAEFRRAYERLSSIRLRLRGKGFVIRGEIPNPLYGRDRPSFVRLDDPYIIDDLYDAEEIEVDDDH
jgi:hypothetical protein